MDPYHDKQGKFTTGKGAAGAAAKALAGKKPAKKSELHSFLEKQPGYKQSVEKGNGEVRHMFTGGGHVTELNGKAVRYSVPNDGTGSKAFDAIVNYESTPKVRAAKAAAAASALKAQKASEAPKEKITKGVVGKAMANKQAASMATFMSQEIDRNSGEEPGKLSPSLHREGTQLISQAMKHGWKPSKSELSLIATGEQSKMIQALKKVPGPSGGKDGPLHLWLEKVFNRGDF